MDPPTAEKPDFRMADGEGYILDRGHSASARLNLHYLLWQRIIKFTIHPSVKLPSHPKIADIATGTAIWAIDIALERPDVQVHGYDIDITQAPPPEWLPANLQIHRWDIFSDPPISALGTFDLLHIRLLTAVLSGVDRLPVIQRFDSLLKPGGWLQWEDLDCTQAHVKRVSPAIPSPSLDAIIDMTRSGGRHDWVAALPAILTEGGFVDTTLESWDDPAELYRALTDQHLLTMEEFASGLVRIGKKEAAGEVREMVREGYKESLRGAALCYPRVFCVARKPLEMFRAGRGDSVTAAGVAGGDVGKLDAESEL